MRLLVRGGSISAGFGVERSYVDIIGEALRPEGVEVINRSRARETSFAAVGTFEEDIEPFHPGILLLHFGVDDAFSVVYRSEFQENLVQVIRLARDRFEPSILLATSHTFDDPYDMEGVSIFYRSLAVMAADLDCTLIPIHHHWAGHLYEEGIKPSDLVLADPRYPNQRGHELIAEVVLPVIRKALRPL